jgi:hypothetical protein
MPTYAEYSIDGVFYASATYAEGDVPQKGYFGFGVYSGSEAKLIENVVVTALSQPDEDAAFYMTEEREWDGRREAYRMFGDKLWDKASNEEGASMGNHHGHH